MKLSVVIPTLNEAAEITGCVESAWGAAGTRMSVAEVVVADGGSVDGGARLAEDAGAAVVLGRRGRGEQLRAGVEATTGDVVLMLHADCRLPRGAGDQIARAIDRGARLGFFRQKIDAPGAAYRWLEYGNLWRGRLLRLPYGDQSIFLRRDLLEEVGGVPGLPLMEDVALMQRARRLARPAVLPGPLRVSARRWKRHGVVRQTLRNWSLLAAFTMGVPAERLVRRYAVHQETPIEPVGVAATRAPN